MKKILALILAIAMVLSVATSAMADVVEVGKGESGDNVYDVYVAGKVATSKIAGGVQIIFSKGEEIGNVYETKPDSNGEYEYKFKFRGEIEDYTLSVRDGEGIEDITDTIKTATYKHEMIVHDMRVVNNGDTASITEGDSVYVNAAVKNKYGDDNLKVKYILAAYDDNGVLLGVKDGKVEEYDYFADETRKIDFSSFKMPAGTTKAKVFAWTDLENMIPVGKTANITKQTNIYFFGASTTTDYADSSWPQQGIRYKFERFFGDGVKVAQFAYGGWSLKTLQEVTTKKIGDANVYDPDNSPYAQMLKVLKPGDYVIFGSTGNNEKYQTGFNNTETTTNVVYPDGTPVPGYTALQSPEVFRERLDKTVAQLLDMGVTPIICTDLGNHTEGGFNDPAGVKASDYVAPQMAVCEKYGIDFIDYRTAVYNYVKNVLKEDYDFFYSRFIMTPEAKQWYKETDHVGAGVDMAKVDKVHFTEAGARLFNAMLVQELKKTDNTINFYFKDM